MPDSIFGELSYSPYVSQFVGSPIEEFRNTAQTLRDTYDAATAQEDVLTHALESLNAADFEGDQAMLNEMRQRYRSIIDQRAQRGDYENLLRAIRKDANKLSAEYAPIQRNMQAYQNYIKSLQDNKDIGEGTRKAALAFSTHNYKGLDPKNIEGSIFRGYNPAKDVNLVEEADKVIKGWEADGTIGKPTSDGRIFYSEKNTFVRPEEVYAAAMNSLLQNPAARDYINQEVLFDTYNREDFSMPGREEEFQNLKSKFPDRSDKEIYGALKRDEILNTASGVIASKYGFSRKDNKWSEDSAYKILLNHRLKKQEEEEKEATYTDIFKKGDSVLFDENGKIVKLDKKESIFQIMDRLSSSKNGRWNPNQGDAGNILQSVFEYFSDNNKDLSPEQKEEYETLKHAVKKINPGIKESEIPKAVEEYGTMLSKDLNLPINLYTNKKKIDNENKRFFDESTGGGDFLTRVIIDSNGNKMTAKEYFKEKFSINVDENLKGSKELPLKGMTVIGEIDNKNPFTPKGKVGTFRGELFIIDDHFNAGVEDVFAHESNKARIKGSHTFQAIDPDDGLKKEFTYIYVPSENKVKLESEKLLE